MKFPYWVTHDGIEYPPNTEIPMEGDKPSTEGVQEDAEPVKRGRKKKSAE